MKPRRRHDPNRPQQASPTLPPLRHWLIAAALIFALPAVSSADPADGADATADDGSAAGLALGAEAGEAMDFTLPHEAPTPYDVIAPTPSEPQELPQPPSGPADPAVADSPQVDEGPLPWDEFFRRLVEDAAKPRPSKPPGEPSLLTQEPAPTKRAQLLDPAQSLASRLVGAFRTRREQEAAYKEYVDEQMTTERAILRLEGLFGNSAVIVVSDRYEGLDRAQRDELALAWLHKWHELNARSISRLVLLSPSNGQLAEHVIYDHDLEQPPPGGTTPFALLAASEEPPEEQGANTSDAHPGSPAAPPDDEELILTDDPAPPSRAAPQAGSDAAPGTALEEPPDEAIAPDGSEPPHEG